MYNAGRGGYANIVEFLMKKGTPQSSLTYALKGAACSGHKILFEKLVKQGAKANSAVLRAAAKGGTWEMIHLVMDLGVKDCNAGALGAAEGNHKEIEYFFRRQGPCDLEMIEKLHEIRELLENGCFGEKSWIVYGESNKEVFHGVVGVSFIPSCRHCHIH